MKLKFVPVVHKGGKGSGHHGHAGRSGKQGGSVSGKDTGGFQKTVSDWVKNNPGKTEQFYSAAEEFAKNNQDKVEQFRLDAERANAKKKRKAEGDAEEASRQRDAKGVWEFYDTAKIKLTAKKQSRHVIAKQGASRYLVDAGDGKGIIVDTATKEVFKLFNIQSIIARGYWKDFDGDESEVLKLL